MATGVLVYCTLANCCALCDTPLMKLLSISLTLAASLALAGAAEKKTSDGKAPAKKAPPADLDRKSTRLNSSHT